MYVDTNILVYLLRPDTAHGQAASAAFRRIGNRQFVVADPDGYHLRFAGDLGQREQTNT